MTSRKGLLILLVGAGIISRFLFLSQPRQVIFDEVHWGKFITGYCCTHENFFDVHPPHGKLLIAGFSKLLGYAGDQNFDPIGTPYSRINPLTIRFFPALAGSLIPGIVFLLLMELGVSLFLAFLGGFFLLFDNALLLQSRIMGLYPMLLFALLGSLLALLFSARKEGMTKWLWLFVSGFLAGWCVGLQFTGVLALALVGLFELRRLFKKEVSLKEVGLELAFITAVASAVYLIGWYLHFEALPKPGSGDLFYKNTGAFWTDLIALHGHMYRASATLTTPHPEASQWWTWPVMTVPIYYWKGESSSLYFVGNPVFWWSISALFLVATLSTLRSAASKKKRKKLPDYSLVLLFGFGLSFAPLMMMKRILFMYHYLTPLALELLFVLIWMNHKGYFKLETETERRWYAGILVLTTAGFLYLLPVTIGFSPPDWYWQIIPWKLWH